MDEHVHFRFVLFHHNNMGGDFGGGVNDTCPIPGSTQGTWLFDLSDPDLVH